MKKIYLSLFLSLAGLYAGAQTLTQANHAPSLGDNYITLQTDSLIGVGSAGANAMWNFTGIVTHSSIASSYTTAAPNNTNYPSSTIKVGTSSNNESYYNSTASLLNYYGGNITISSVAATLTYTSPAIFASYPMNLNSASSSTIGGSLFILNNNGTFTGNANVIADGTGTLALPSRTYTNAMRLVTTQTINASTSFGPVTVNQKNYDYYAVGTSKFPVYTISTTTIVSILSPTPSTQTIAYVQQNYEALSVKEDSGKIIEMNVFPNPSNAFVNFATESTEAKHILIYDVTGKLIEKQNLSEGKLKLNVSGYAAGAYMYSVIDNNNQTLKTGKLAVSH